VEKRRVDQFFQRIDGIRNLHSTCVCERNCSLTKGMDKLTLSVLFYLWTKGMEQKHFPRNIADYWNSNLIKSDEFIKNTRAVTKIAKLSVLLSSLMPSPLWFFSSLQTYAKLLVEGFTMYSYLSTKKFFSKSLFAAYSKSKKFRFFDFKGLLLVSQCLDKYVSDKKVNITKILQQKFPDKEGKNSGQAGGLQNLSGAPPINVRIGADESLKESDNYEYGKRQSFNQNTTNLDSSQVNDENFAAQIGAGDLQDSDPETSQEDNRLLLEASITMELIEMQVIFIVQRWEH
jgi:hypothetical protein